MYIFLVCGRHRVLYVPQFERIILNVVSTLATGSLMLRLESTLERRYLLLRNLHVLMPARTVSFSMPQATAIVEGQPIRDVASYPSIISMRKT